MNEHNIVCYKFYSCIHKKLVIENVGIALA